MQREILQRCGETADDVADLGGRIADRWIVGQLELPDLMRPHAIPAPQPLARAEFTTLRMRLIKIGARIAETASRVRIALAAGHPEAMLFASLARYLHPAGP